MQLFISCLVGKFSIFVLKLFRKKASTWPGHLSLAVDPNLVEKLENKLSCGSVLITGTNGKTTTANMIAHILKQAGFTVIHNSTSANLMNGLATSLILSTKFKGIYPQYVDKSVGVFEIDEAVFGKAVTKFTPEVVVFLNLSRDQLDRYGEIDMLVNKWRSSLSILKKRGAFPKVVYYGKDTRLQDVVKGFPKELLCSVCVADTNEENPHFFQINAHLSAYAVSFFGISTKKAAACLTDFKPVFGRGEIIDWNGSEFHLFLTKNPKSFNENLKFWITKAKKDTVFWLLLNDNIPDGRDISWIWDIDSTLLLKCLKNRKIFISGKRAYDLALRLKYSGLDPLNFVVIPKVKKAAETIIKNEKNVITFPTYSAMLEVRKVLTGKKL